MIDRISLEKAAIDFSDANAPHPRIYELAPKAGRDLLEEVQSSKIDKQPVDIVDVEVDTGKWGAINVRIVRPQNTATILPVIFYIHGAGWVFGSAQTHDKLIRELAVRTNSVVIFPEYSRSPEAKYPTAIEQNYAVLQKLPELKTKFKLNIAKLTVAGDSVGGNMSAVMTIMTKQRQGLKINQQVLYYPVTDANFETPSYLEFADNYYLTRDGMKWFWDQYTERDTDRADITASPLRATLDDLKGLPAALILTDEADVLRDEGEAYASRLRDAGVEVTQVRFQGMIHDFVMLNALDQTNATRAAMALSTAWIKQKNQVDFA